MKKTLATFAIAIASAGAVFAEGPIETDYAPGPWVSTLTRAQVIAEFFAALQAGETATESTLTREQVMAQTRSPRARAEMAAMSGEDSGSAYLIAMLDRSRVTAEPVLAAAA
jgi:hypothetical protein